MTDLLSRIFIKNYKNTTDPRVRTAYGTLVSVVGVILNLLLFAAKFTVGTLFGAVSITADGINNLSDAGSQIISFLSFRISSKPADREHPYGHGRIEYIASMIVSFLILFIGFEMLKESIDKILHPALPERSWIAAIVLGGSILVKLWLALFNQRIGKRIDSSVMRATAADSLSDVLSTSAVLIATLVLLLFPNMTLNLDAYMGIVVAILILVAGLKILNEAKNAILGGGPSEEVVRRVVETVGKYPEALGIHDMAVHNYGPGRVLASLHIEVDGKVDIFKSHDMIDNIERDLRAQGIEATVHMDPIVTDCEELTLWRARVCEAACAIAPSIRVHDFRMVKGETHTNLIFDIEVPFEVHETDEELRRALSDAVSRISPDVFLVITVDRG